MVLLILKMYRYGGIPKYAFGCYGMVFSLATGVKSAMVKNGFSSVQFTKNRGRFLAI